MSRLAEMQARFQQRQMQEKEEKLLRLYENQQQRAFEKVSRGSSGGSSVSGGTSPVGLGNTLGATGAGRVRQMFDERRQKAGIDRSYPLEPLKQTTRLNGHVPANRVASLDRTIKNPSTRNSTMTVKTSVQRTVSQSTNGKPLKSRTVKQSNHAAYANGKLVEENSTYEERNDNDHAINMMKQQQRELEMMMNNHNLNDSIDDEEMPNVEIDEVDEGRDEFSPSPNENDNYIERNRNGSYKEHEISSSGSTPTRTISNNNRPSPATKKTVSKTTSITKPSPRSSAEEKKRPTAMKAATTPSRAPARHTSTMSSGRAPASSARSGRSGQATADDNLSSCKFCQRRFAPDRLGKHEEICARTAKKKRKVYDAVKHRVQGTDVEGYARKGPKGTTSVKKVAASQTGVAKPPQMPKSDWRRQHEEFIATIRAAKQAQAHVAAGGRLSDLPPPPPSLNPDYVQCPHCGRRFNEAAAARHIPKCATMLHNKPNRMGAQPSRKKF